MKENRNINAINLQPSFQRHKVSTQLKSASGDDSEPKKGGGRLKVTKPSCKGSNTKRVILWFAIAASILIIILLISLRTSK